MGQHPILFGTQIAFIVRSSTRAFIWQLFLTCTITLIEMFEYMEGTLLYFFGLSLLKNKQFFIGIDLNRFPFPAMKKPGYL
jgi:hypothetical protein